jgi:hypothetical protein
MNRAFRIALIATVSAATIVMAGRFVGSGGGGALAQDVDMNTIFRCTAKDDAGVKQCNEGRQLIMDNCTSCHTFVPIVLQQFDRNGWETEISRHISDGRDPGLSPEQAKTITEYLIANFNANLPVPTLPKELLDSWTNY